MLEWNTLIQCIIYVILLITSSLGLDGLLSSHSMIAIGLGMCIGNALAIIKDRHDLHEEKKK